MRKQETKDGDEKSKPTGIVAAADFMEKILPEPPQVIHGVIRAGQVGMMAAASKIGKTWAMLALWFAVATGRKWMGWPTTQGRVLYINAELPCYDLQRRSEQLVTTLDLPIMPDGLDLWHLRGSGMTIRALIPKILHQQEINGAPYSLILPDPLYCFNGGRDENDNSEQAKTMAELSELAERSGAAVWATHHFSKGNKSQTEHLDRASGAGMFARAVDTFMTLTRHEVENCYSVETTCRSFARPEPFVVRWEYPLWRIDGDLDPDALKLHNRPGRTPRYSPEGIVELLPKGGATFTEWRQATEKQLGVKEGRFLQLRKKALADGLAVQDVFGKYVKPEGGR